MNEPAIPAVAAGLWQRLGARLARSALVALAALAMAGAAAAQGTEDLPGRVGRVADVASELYIAPQDKPDAWTPASINYPVTTGDNLWQGGDGRAEIDVGGAQFRMAGQTSVHVSHLDDRRFALFVAQGRVSLRVRAIEPGDVALVDTPNAQVAITRPGLYRIDVTEDRLHTVVIVREGEANVQTQAAVSQVLPGQVAYADGADPQYATVQNGVGSDGFDSWAASRDRLYRVRGNSYVSPQMVGAADLDQYGTWQQTNDYGAVWYPNDVAADWAPYRNGYWVDVGTWGPTWVDYAPWGYAPFHYGRWAFVGGRWGWCPGAYTPRPLWAPALVAWTGGAGWSVSVTVGGPVYGWVPLGWGEPFRPWWGRCSTGCWDRFNRPYAVNVAVVRPWSPPPQRWRNASAPNGVTAVPFQAFQARQPVQQNLVRVSRDTVANAPALASPPVFRNDPSRAATPRPVQAPPPASSFQPALARQGPTSPGVAVPIQRGVAPGTAAQPGLAPGSREARPQPAGAQAVGPVPGSPAMRGQPQAGQSAQPYGRGQPQATPQATGAVPVRPAQVRPAAPAAAQPVLRPQQVQPSSPSIAQPLTRSPQAQPVAPSAQRSLQPQASQPVMRAQPQLQPSAPASAVPRPAPAAQVAPASPAMARPAPQAAPPPGPQAAPPPAPAARGQPTQPSTDGGRQGNETGAGGSISRGAR